MSIRGTVTFECESCHAEEVMDADEVNYTEGAKQGISIEFYAGGWVMDDDGDLHCPQCCEDDRAKGDDDGREYADPRDYMAGLE